MIRKSLSAIVFLVLSGAAFAGSCPLLINDIDAALDNPAIEQRLSDKELSEARSMRNKGEEAHRAGDHRKSMEALNRAKALLGLS